MQSLHYFDNAATTAPSPSVLEEYCRVARDYPGNPSAHHSLGLESKALLEECRARIAKCLSVEPSNLFFTSGATESINIVMASLLWAKKPGEVIISSLEHEAVSAWSGILKDKGWNIKTLSAKGGYVKAEDLEKLLTKETRLVAVMRVSNVLGTVQDISSLVEVTRAKEKEFGRPIFFFSDSVQALGKVELELDVDGASFSAHKIHGPRGVGLLYLRKGMIQALSQAGGQEKGVRGGTENLPAIAAFTVAVEEACKNYEANREKVEKMNHSVREALKDSKVKVLTPVENSSPYILTVATPLPSEVAIRMLQDRGFLLSAGSACSNNARGKAEAVFRNSGFANDAGGAIRISFSHLNSEEEALSLAQNLKELI